MSGQKYCGPGRRKEPKINLPGDKDEKRIQSKRRRKVAPTVIDYCKSPRERFDRSE